MPLLWDTWPLAKRTSALSKGVDTGGVRQESKSEPQ